ncbi:MAG: choice-of-anchor E domain-containing protein [Iodobacter sp.]
MKLTKLVLLLLASMTSFAASAAVQTLSFSGNHSLQNTNWTDSLNIQKFNTALGALQSVSLDLYSNVTGTARFESLDSSATTVALDLGGIIRLATAAADATLITVNPLVANKYNVTAFDGSIDLGGTSGKTINGLQAADSASVTLNSASWLSFFTGSDTVALNLTAAGKSSASGSGNLISQFSTNADAGYKVTYNYIATPVPEPETYALMGLGVIALLARRRKQS